MDGCGRVVKVMWEELPIGNIQLPLFSNKRLHFSVGAAKCFGLFLIFLFIMYVLL